MDPIDNKTIPGAMELVSMSTLMVPVLVYAMDKTGRMLQPSAALMCRCNQALTVSKSKAVTAHSGVVDQVIATSA